MTLVMILALFVLNHCSLKKTRNADKANCPGYNLIACAANIYKASLMGSLQTPQQALGISLRQREVFVVRGLLHIMCESGGCRMLL